MWRIRGWFSDGADAVDPSSSNPAARDDGLFAWPQFGAGRGGAGAWAPSLSNDPPAEAGGAPGGFGPQLSISGLAAMADSDLSSNSPTLHVAYDPLGFDGGLGGAGASAPALSNDAPADAGGVLGGGSGLPPSVSSMAPIADSDLSPNPPTLHIAYDPLAAFLDGLNGFASLRGAGTSPLLPAGPTSLSNGLNADAGAAQLVSALASVPDGNSAFNATPFAPPSHPEPQTILAAATQ